jgi:hypothetical protein
MLYASRFQLSSGFEKDGFNAISDGIKKKKGARP